MIDFSSVDTSSLNKIALFLGVAFFVVLLVGLLVVKLLKLLRLPNRIIQVIVNLLAVFGFLYFIAYLGDTFF